MAKREQQPLISTKKHLARADRERRETRWIVAGTVVTAAVVLSLIGYGWLKEAVLAPRQAVATVNGVEIRKGEFRARVAWLMPASADVASYGQNVLDRLIDDVLIQEEAQRRGLSVADAEVEDSLHGFFFYFPNGTPTPRPSLTPDPTSLANTTPTALPTAGPSPTVTPTLGPQPTATEYTEQAYADTLQAYLKANGISEAILRGELRAGLYRARLATAFELETDREAEQVHARHILVSTKEEGQSVLDRLKAGEAWTALAAELSRDQSNKDKGGELGWLAPGATVKEFEDAVFSGPVGEPFGPVETSFGWHVLWVLGREVRPLDAFSFQQAVQLQFEAWLTAERAKATITTSEDWQDWLPAASGA
jgi:parvulin-like peptidyl-prolyl isomerase